MDDPPVTFFSYRNVYSVSLKFFRNGASPSLFILPVDELSESVGESVDELIFGFGVESRKPFGLYDELEGFDGVKIE